MPFDFFRCDAFLLSSLHILLIDDRDQEGHPKGDGSVCYVKPESVDMAINVLHEGQIRPGVTIEVSPLLMVFHVRDRYR